MRLKIWHTHTLFHTHSSSAQDAHTLTNKHTGQKCSNSNSSQLFGTLGYYHWQLLVKVVTSPASFLCLKPDSVFLSWPSEQVRRLRYWRERDESVRPRRCSAYWPLTSDLADSDLTAHSVLTNPWPFILRALCNPSVHSMCPTPNCECAHTHTHIVLAVTQGMCAVQVKVWTVT